MEEKQLEDFLPDKNTSYIKKFNNSNINSKINEEQVIECIRTVVDPEIPVNLYDLGLIYDINVNEENDVQVLMTLTAPNCPFGDMIMMETEFAVRSVKDVNLVKINLTFDPPWNPDQPVSDEAKYQMGLL